MKTILVLFVLFSISHGVVFDCAFVNYPWGFIGNIYSCFNPSVSNLKNAEISEVRGSHEEGFANRNVEGLFVSSQFLPWIPKNLHEYFPNLKAIEWHNSSLMSVTSRDLLPFSNLELFFSTVNKLKSIDGNLFEFSPKLKWISFKQNLLEEVGSGLMSNLVDLKHANFQDNICIDFVAKTPETVKDLIGKIEEKCFVASECSLLAGEMDEMRAQLRIHESRIIELEKLVREIGAKP